MGLPVSEKLSILGIWSKVILEGYTSRRKVDNKDDFGNKRLKLAGELLERELKVHLGHAQKRTVKAMQRDLYPVRTIHLIEQYFDAAIVSAHGGCRFTKILLLQLLLLCCIVSII
nr:DNA-directed RNA polymerases IV and V subunit 2-like [Tanacetum cinerariifolium]